MTPAPRRIDVWHNMLWPSYKGEVFSSLFGLSDKSEFSFRFIQISETSISRVNLSSVDTNRHRYPFLLLFKGQIESVSFFKRFSVIVRLTLRTDAALSILTGYERPESWAQLIILKVKRKKIAFFCDSTIHDRPQSFFKGYVKRVIFSNVDAFFCYGKRSRDYAVHYGANANNCYIPCQAAALPFDYNHEDECLRRKNMTIKRDTPMYLYVGRLSIEKGLDTLLYSFSNVLEVFPKAMLTIIGDGPTKTSLSDLVAELSLEDSVIIAGSKSGKALEKEYQSATCLILPSRSEPWGLVVNEAFAFGCPAIVSERCGCVPELIIAGVTGYVHRTDDINDLSGKMISAVDCFSDTGKTAQSCIDLIRQYSPDVAAQRIISGIRSTLTEIVTQHVG